MTIHANPFWKNDNHTELESPFRYFCILCQTFGGLVEVCYSRYLSTIHDHPGPSMTNEDHRNTWGLPAKKMPKFAQEFGGQNRKLDPKLPAKKRLPQEMIAAGRNGYGWWWRSGLAWVSCCFWGEGRQTDILSECYWWFCYKVLDFASILFVIDTLQAPVSWKKRLFLQQRVKSWSGNERSSKRLLKQFVKLPSDYAACKLDLEGLHTYNVPYSFYSQRVVQFWNLSSHGWVLPPLESAYWRDVRYCGSQI